MISMILPDDVFSNLVDDLLKIHLDSQFQLLPTLKRKRLFRILSVKRHYQIIFLFLLKIN